MAGLRDFLRKAEKWDIGEASQRLTLTKRNPETSLSAAGALHGTMRVHLHWTARASGPAPGSARERWKLLLQPNPFRPVTTPQMGQRPVGVDLDLGCLYELSDGTKGVVQPLGPYMGDLQRPPYIRLSHDDRSGAPSGEVMFVDMEHWESFRRLLFFVYIYDETPAFAETHATLTLFPTAGPRIEVQLEEHAPKARSCAVLLLERDGSEVTVRREVRYVYGFQAELDRLYGWGLQWQRGYKPVS
ncbi:Tellurium resistance [Streptacidiphilus monticola]|uniref:Tellurium resistance n=1 Tax=Streptacidiphilus monticola TaxID=2161674 RepID=A0ABW1FXH3_9ACTN